MHKPLSQWAKVSAYATTATKFPEVIEQATNVLQMALDDLAEVRDLLDELAEYFDDRADADMDQDGYVPNTAMRLLTEINNVSEGSGY